MGASIEVEDIHSKKGPSIYVSIISDITIFEISMAKVSTI